MRDSIRSNSRLHDKWNGNSSSDEANKEKFQYTQISKEERQLQENYVQRSLVPHDLLWNAGLSPVFPLRKAKGIA